MPGEGENIILTRASLCLGKGENISLTRTSSIQHLPYSSLCNITNASGHSRIICQIDNYQCYTYL